MAVEKVEKTHGGRRAGSGMKKGQKTKKTIEREFVLQRIKERVFAATDPMIDGQLASARGHSYLFKIEKEKIVGPKGGVTYKAKRPQLVTNPVEIEHYLAGDYDKQTDRAATYYYITTEKPETGAAKELWDRALGKSTQAITGPDGGPVQIQNVEVTFVKAPDQG